MNMFRKEKGSPAASSPPLPPRSLPSEQGSNREAASLPKSKRTRVMGVMQKVVNPFKASSQTADSSEPRKDSAQNPGMISSVIQKVNPFKSWHSKDAQPPQIDASSGRESRTDSDDLSDEPLTSSPQSVWYVDDVGSAELKSPANERPKTRKKTFRIKRILPTALFSSGSKDSDARPQEVEVQTLEMVDMPELHDPSVLDPLEDEDGLLAWWRTVDGWTEWNETAHNHQSEEVAEEAADRVFMAARLFVDLFNRRGASLQRRVLSLLTLADAADDFHKKTVSASVGGGVAGVAGSITTITGLVLAPFTAGTSLIVTAVGIGVATAGGVASASANITDTVHSKADRKKVEKMIQDYQEEMNDIKDCLEFLQEGMETLEEWNFEQYARSISQKHLNQNVKHVMKEGGRAGKALVINTESLISTVQVLSVAGGAAKAAQVMSITTGVMSGLFLALDVFFLAKDSAELRKGAKTEFAAKIRDVCKDLQDGLLELNRIKEELQKTMDGIQVEEEDDNDQDDDRVLESELEKLELEE
ncbi:N6-adenosine-methyltransferase subunit METTL3 isoform X4 [Phycodurus eques]|uniref:N6-adenosine-methyltransferase subunit METTL3 isoform X4 n=1 Tax=Phycodurus eques TaxID=693459 RepID=UPI002ACEDE68|nr:N6-adenosine-methyltransferase subunit METTL3 isoform X4 [Phycodurus eques]